MVMTESPPCWRKCPHRKNIIYFKDGPAGLSDRKFIIRDLAELAGYLCAHLVLPPPTELLDPIHNFNEQVSIENDWSDYFNITFAEDGEPVVRNDVFIDEARKKIDRSDWLHVISSDRKMRDDFEMIHRFTWEQSTNSSKGFVWEIHKIYRSDLWENDRLPDLAPPEVKKKYEDFKDRDCCKDEEDDVRLAVADNSNTPVKTLFELDDDIDYVRSGLGTNSKWKILKKAGLLSKAIMISKYLNIL
jgi:hypothetical protein